MATKKKTTKKLSEVTANKSAFVRQYPTMTPTDLVALAAKAGLKFSPKYVYTVRWKTAAKAKVKAKPKSVVVRVPAAVGKAFVARRKAAKQAAQAVPVEEPKVIALTYKSKLTKDAKGGWQAVTGPAPALDVSGIRSRNQDQQFKQLTLEIGLTRADVLLAELRAVVLPPA